MRKHYLQVKLFDNHEDLNEFLESHSEESIVSVDLSALRYVVLYKVFTEPETPEAQKTHKKVLVESKAPDSLNSCNADAMMTHLNYFGTDNCVALLDTLKAHRIATPECLRRIITDGLSDVVNASSRIGMVTAARMLELLVDRGVVNEGQLESLLDHQA